MNRNRVQGAPRLIEWTGERAVPWIDDPPVIYEHFHRYLFAAALVPGRRVLDLASGEGYGTAMLAERAVSVLGLDIDEPSVEHARANYSAPGLNFQVGDALALEALDASAFDVVVALEVLEHVADQERVLAGIRHVLAPDGILIVSTPERVAYAEEREFENPFHVHELTLAEFRELLAGGFAHVQTWAQRTVSGSVLARSSANAVHRSAQDFTIDWREDHWELAAELPPMYVLAVASNTPLPEACDLSLLADPGQGLLRHAQAARAREEELRRGAEQHAERVTRAAEQQTAELRRQLLSVGDGLADERRRVAELEARAAELEGRNAQAEQLIATIQDELVAAETFRAGVESSQVWRLFQRARQRGYGALGGRRSRLGRLLERAIRLVTRSMLRSMR